MSRLRRFEPEDPVWVIVPDRSALRGWVVRNPEGLSLIGCVTVRTVGMRSDEVIVSTAKLAPRTSEGPGSIPPLAVKGEAMTAESFSAFVARIEAAIPSAHIEVVSRPGDERGEVVVYTGLWLNEDDDTVAVEL